MKTRLSSTEPAAPAGFTNAVFAETVDGGVRKIAVHVPAAGGIGRWWARAILSGLQLPADDVLVNRYRVVLEDGQYITIARCSTTAKVGPVASHFAADILRSDDDGATWVSIFTPISPPTDTDLAYVAAGDFRGDQFAFVIDTLNQNDLLRLDVINNEDAAGVEVVLEGMISTTSP